MNDRISVLMIDQIAKINFRYTFPLVNALVRTGVDIKLIVDGKEDDDTCRCEKIKLFNTSDKRIGSISKLYNYICAYYHIYKIICKEKVDILHTQWYSCSPIDYCALHIIKKRTGVKYVATVHDILPFDEKWYDRYFYMKAYGISDRVIVQADNNVERIKKLFPGIAEKVVMIPHGHMIDCVEIADQNESRKRLGIPENKRVFLFFGQIKKVKGVELFLKALVHLREKCPDLYAVVAGSVWKTDFSACEQIIKDNNLTDIVKTEIRYIEDEEVKYYFAGADACILPYTEVYQSGVVQLAYGYEKPVIVSDLPAFTQIVREEINGFVFRCGDEQGLTEAIEKAYFMQKDKLEDLGRKGKELVKEKLDWDMIARRVMYECYR